MAYESTVSEVKRKEDEGPDDMKSLVSEWQSKVQKAKAHWEDDFKRMREDQQLAYAGASKEWKESGAYVVPIITRHINQAVASLYAKNPRVLAEARDRLEYTVWDGREDSLKAAMESVAMGIPDPNAMAILEDVQQAQQKQIMLKKICKTLVILIQYYWKEQGNGFKKQMKQLVRRSKTCGIGYVWLGFQRLLEKKAAITNQINDVSSQIAKIEALSADAADGLLEDDSARLAELRTMLADLQAQESVIVREGPVYDFPRSTEIIVDEAVVQLNGLIGANWIARELFMDPKKVQANYGVDICGSAYTGYSKSKDGYTTKIEARQGDSSGKDETLACVWEVWNKENNQTFTIIEGYSDFIVAPKTPDVQLERFWPLFTLTFNDVEHDCKKFPLSDVHMLRHSQEEYNRSRELRRLHREANKPAYATAKGKFSPEDIMKLQVRPPHAILEMQGMVPGDNIEALLQPIKSAPIDPALYETNSEMEDVYRTVGTQEATLGGSSGATATEVSQGAQSQATASESNVDELDDVLTELAEATGQMLLLTLDIATVKKIAGPGAVWPEVSREEIVEEVYVNIKAGSSGRPNKAAELADLERGMPYLMQMPGIPATPLGEKYSDLLDLDLTDKIIEGAPSITAMNAMAAKMGMAQPGTGDPASDPNQQGAQGQQNQQGAQQNERQPGGQPAYPAPNNG